jgi:hypothetical protein
MGFKKRSSKVEGDCPFNGVARKARRKALGQLAKVSFRVRKRIQNPPWKQLQNVIAQVVGWEKLNPTTKW